MNMCVTCRSATRCTRPDQRFTIHFVMYSLLSMVFDRHVQQNRETNAQVASYRVFALSGNYKMTCCQFMAFRYLSPGHFCHHTSNFCKLLVEIQRFSQLNSLICLFYGKMKTMPNLSRIVTECVPYQNGNRWEKT